MISAKLVRCQAAYFLMIFQGKIFRIATTSRAVECCPRASKNCYLHNIRRSNNHRTTLSLPLPAIVQTPAMGAITEVERSITCD